MKTYKTLLVLTLMVVLISTISLMSNSNGIEQDGKYLAFAEVMPEPVGGIGAIIKNIRYPDMAKRFNIEGKVYVLAHVNENGDAEEVKLVRGIGSGCDEVAMEAVKNAKYTPGKNKGKNVKVKLTMAITFRLN
ncbi:MAG: energy transducer TonB [Melioribacteraceae bacterium]|nr:energy transducer TonB [Melioribacteraceae bacterium]